MRCRARTPLAVTADSAGSFKLNCYIPQGRRDFFIDGRNVVVTTQSPSEIRRSTKYPILHFEVLAIRGWKNILPHPIYLPPLLMSEAKIVGGNEDVSLKIPGFEGFEMIVKANSVTFPDGSKQGPLVVSPVHVDRLPMVPPGGAAAFPAPAWTIQPTGTRFDPPIEVRMPNDGRVKIGESVPVIQWDHDLGQFVPMGRGTATEDGAQIITDPGSGITKAGWGGACVYNDPRPNCGIKCDKCEKRSANGCACEFDQQPDTDRVFSQYEIYKKLEVPLYTKYVMSLLLGADDVSAKFKLAGNWGDSYSCCEKKRGKVKNSEFTGGGELEGALEWAVGGAVGKVISKLGGKAIVKFKAVGVVVVSNAKFDACQDEWIIRSSLGGTFTLEGGAQWEVLGKKASALLGGSVNVAWQPLNKQGNLVRICTGGALFAKAELEGKLGGDSADPIGPFTDQKAVLFNFTKAWPIDFASGSGCVDASLTLN